MIFQLSLYSYIYLWKKHYKIRLVTKKEKKNTVHCMANFINVTECVFGVIKTMIKK